MKIVIDIDDKTYKAFIVAVSVNLGRSPYKGIIGKCLNALKNGTVLPKGHGRLIDAVNLIEEVKGRCDNPAQVIEVINDEMTILEADKGDKE